MMRMRLVMPPIIGGLTLGVGLLETGATSGLFALLILSATLVALAQQTIP